MISEIEENESKATVAPILSSNRRMTQSRFGHALGTGKCSELETALVELMFLNLTQLRAKWRSLIGKPPPRVSASLLRLALAWELQASALGGLSRRSQETLDQLACSEGNARRVLPGMRLCREWHGRMHVVVVEEDGTIRWNGQTWTSLSAVARSITGTRWSGPAFFGLKPDKKPV